MYGLRDNVNSDNDTVYSRTTWLDERSSIVIFDAPAHFYEGAEIFIVEDMPDIQQVSQSDYIEAVTDAVIQTVMATGGRLFVLLRRMIC